MHSWASPHGWTHLDGVFKCKLQLPHMRLQLFTLRQQPIDIAAASSKGHACSVGMEAAGDGCFCLQSLLQAFAWVDVRVC